MRARTDLWEPWGGNAPGPPGPTQVAARGKRQSFTRRPPPQGRTWTRWAIRPNKAERTAISQSADRSALHFLTGV